MKKSRFLLRRTKAALLKFHRGEQGAEGIEKLLILAAVALPILAVIIFFGEDLKEWLAGIWQDVKGDSEDLSDAPSL